MNSTNAAYPLVEEYFVRKHMAKLGFSFDASELTDFDVHAFSIIGSTIQKIENDERKRSARKKK